MRKSLIVAAVSLFAGLALAVTPSTAHADSSAPVWGTCPNLKSFYANEDEQDRLPAVTTDGLRFSGDQLVHHAVAIDLKDVHPGSYAATPAPSLVDFFSVEVYSTADPHGYATLRYEAAGPEAGKWNIGGTGFYDTDAVRLATGHNRSTNVVSFGVGYVATPADGTATVVSSITFHGVTYPLSCKPAVTPSATPSATHSASHSSSPHATPDPTSSAATGALAITGPNGWMLGAVAVSLSGLGGALLFVSRRRRTHFRA